MPHNIEKSVLRRREYVGYGAGKVWRIRKTGFGGWEAYEQAGPAYRKAPTLDAMSSAIES